MWRDEDSQRGDEEIMNKRIKGENTAKQERQKIGEEKIYETKD